MKAKSSWKKHNRRGEEKEMSKTLELKHKANSSLSKINVIYSIKGLSSNKKGQDSIASSRFLRPTALASESFQIKSF